MNSHGFVLAIGLREVSVGHEDKPRPSCVSAESNPKCKSELIDLLKEVLFRLMRCLAWID